MSNAPTVSLYRVSFKGIYGRNRTPKFTSKGEILAPADVASDPDKLRAWVATVAEDFATDIDAKSGTLNVKRYDDCEVSSYEDGLSVITTYVIPVLDSATVYTAKVGA